MNELRNNFFNRINQVNQAWVDEYNDAVKAKRNMDITKVMSNYSKIVQEANDDFINFEKRKKKGGIFG